MPATPFTTGNMPRGTPIRDGLAFDDAEPDLDQVQPRPRGGREVGRDPWVGGEPVPRMSSPVPRMSSTVSILISGSVVIIDPVTRSTPKVSFFWAPQYASTLTRHPSMAGLTAAEAGLDLGDHEPEVVVDAYLGDCCAEGSESGVETVRLVEKVHILRRPGIVHAREDGGAALEHPRAVRLLEHAGQETIEDEAAQ